MRKVAKKQYNIPMLGEKAPAFEAETTRGKIMFPKDYEGKWVVLFSSGRFYSGLHFGSGQLCLHAR